MNHLILKEEDQQLSEITHQYMPCLCIYIVDTHTLVKIRVWKTVILMLLFDVNTVSCTDLSTNTVILYVKQ